jgi:hypothetical protein
VVEAALLGREERRRRPVVRHVEPEPLELRPGLLVLDGLRRVDLRVEDVELDVKLGYPAVLVVEPVPELVA